jgi:hypothetical protein
MAKPLGNKAHNAIANDVRPRMREVALAEVHGSKASGTSVGRVDRQHSS